MDIKKITAYAALAGGVSLGALGFGAGSAHAETSTVVPGNTDQWIQQAQHEEQQAHAGDPTEHDAGLGEADPGEVVPVDHPIPDQHSMAAVPLTSVVTPIATPTQKDNNADN